MKRQGPLRTSVCILVLVSFVTVSCAGLSPEGTLGCLAAGAAVGAGAGAAIGRGDWKDILIGVGVGALAGLATCIVVAELRSQQVKDYQETKQAVKYEPAQGDAVQITRYAVMPAATSPGTEVAFNATYYVMTPNPDQEVPITETRVLKAYDPTTGGYRELGRVVTPVTVKPGTRQADGKFDVRSRVAEGNYLLIFQVAKNGMSDSKELSFVVTKNPAVLGAASSRIAEVVAEGAKAPEPTGQRSAPGPVQSSQTAPTAPSSPAPGAPIAGLGEQEPKPPTPSAVSPMAPREAGKTEREKPYYFVASKVSGKGNLREGPGTKYKIVGEIREGERFLIIDRIKNPDEQTPWYKIRLDTGLEAWVAGSLGTEVQE